MNEHLITTDFNGRKRLTVLEQFEIDYSLPKYKDKATGQIASDQATALINGGFTTVTATQSNVMGVGLFNQPMVIYGNSYGAGFSVFARLKALFTKAKVATIEAYHSKTSISAILMFESLMGAGKKLENLKGRLADYAKSIEYARQMGQTALVEQLTARLAIIEIEAVLIEAGCASFIEETTLIDFVTKCEKGLRLDYVKNFTRLIPHGAQVKKIKLDELRTFDSHVILHYDPANKSSALTKKEIEKKKDPILFGLIKGSPRLYHIFSWKDEFCDLTFPDLIAKYGKDVLTLK